jgi:hypothetical protein
VQRITSYHVRVKPRRDTVLLAWHRRRQRSAHLRTHTTRRRVRTRARMAHTMSHTRSHVQWCERAVRQRAQPSSTAAVLLVATTSVHTRIYTVSTRAPHTPMSYARASCSRSSSSGSSSSSSSSSRRAAWTDEHGSLDWSAVRACDTSQSHHTTPHHAPVACHRALLVRATTLSLYTTLVTVSTRVHSQQVSSTHS